MDENLQREAQRLAASWQRHGQAMLREYLVEDVEDPRINAQSILVRHHLIDLLFPGRFVQLMAHELRFSCVMNWLLVQHKKSIRSETLQAVLSALVSDEAAVEGVRPPPFLRETFAMLPAEVDGVAIADYVSEALLAPVHDDGPLLDAATLRTFMTAWSGRLAACEGVPLCVLEAACGSANDYRFMDASGLARFLDYVGIDIAARNIENAGAMFPDVRFAVGNAMAIDAPDDSFDCVIAHDLVEHLSIEAMQRAVAEMCRVAKRSVCLGLFNAHDGAGHEVKQVEDYHWNRLSIPRLRESFIACGGRDIRVTHVDALLRDRFNYPHTHNKNAYVLEAFL